MAETRLELKNTLFYLLLFLICHFMTGGVQWAHAAPEDQAGQSDPTENPEEQDAVRYGACLRLVEDKPEEALNFARDWNIERQGLSAARHCEALALMALDRPVEAAELLEREADSILTGNGLGDYALANRRKLRTDLYSQAALAWERAGKLDQAYSALSSALLAAGDAQDLSHDIYIERGKIQSKRREYSVAIEDLTRAIELAPEDVEGYFLRAKVFRYHRKYAAARLDISRALDLDRDNAELLLESGILYRVAGEILKAEQEWRKVVELYPDSAVAVTARENLALLQED